MKNIKRTQRGLSTPLALVFLSGFLLIGGVAVSTSMQADRFGNRQKESLQAMNLAEAGIMNLYDRIRSEMRVDGTYTMSLPSTPVTTREGGSTVTVGTYTARVVNVSARQEDVGPDHDRKRVTTYQFILEGTGNAGMNRNVTLRSRFTATLSKNLMRREEVIETGPPVGMIYVPQGALASNTTVSFRTRGGFRTFSPDGNSGHVIANDGVDWDADTGNKNAISNPNVLDVQGQFIVGDAAYNATIGAGGIGNSNGSRNFRVTPTASLPGWPDNSSSGVIRAQSRIAFASETEVDGWVNDWRTEVGSPMATRVNGSLTTASMPLDANGERVLETPAYIDGNLVINPGTLLKLKPSTTNPRRNVIYVRGKVQNQAILENLGVKLVIEGSYEDQPSAQYRLSTQGSPWSQIGQVMQNAAMISVKQASDAIEWQSNASVTTGLVYAAKGGIEIDSSNGEVRGMMAAGGTGSNGGISVRAGGGSSFVVHFAPEAGIPGDAPANERRIDVSYVENGVHQQFSPSRLIDWVQR